MANAMFSSDNLLVSGGINTQNYYRLETAFKDLGKRAIMTATHVSGECLDRPKCHKNTRVAVLNRLQSWSEAREQRENESSENAEAEEGDALEMGDEEKPILWLYGDAGAGKSAIGQTFAERCARERRLLGRFFFSRNDASRATQAPLVATIAYQAALAVPGLKDLITAVVERDPRIFDKDLKTQFKTLLINPFKVLSVYHPYIRDGAPYVMIIDGLDECATDERQVQKHILEVVAGIVSKRNIGLKILVTSRPESEIRSAFDTDLLRTLSTRLALDASFHPDDDIRLFLNDTFINIKKTHPFHGHIPVSWPSMVALERIVTKSSGQFIYASTVIRYVSSLRHKPVDRLEVVLGLRPAMSDNDLPFAALDSLYRHIFSTIPVENLGMVLKILGLLIISSQLRSGGKLNDPDFLQPFLSLGSGDLIFYLADVVSVVDCPPQRSLLARIRITHASLSDFLLDERRSKNFYLNQKGLFTEMTTICQDHIHKGTAPRDVLEFSLANFPPLCLEAEHTPGIQNDLMRLSLESIYDWCYMGSGVGVTCFPCFSTEFLTVVKTMPNSADLLRHHYQEFDRCMHKLILEASHDSKNILLITTLVGQSRRPCRFPTRSGGPPVECQPFQEKQAPKSTNHYIFLMFCEICLLESEPLKSVLLDFFNNPIRSGKYALDGGKYAEAALACFAYIDHHDIRNASTKSFDDVRGNEEHATVAFALAHLPELLKRCSSSVALISFIQSGQFNYDGGDSICFKKTAKYIKSIPPDFRASPDMWEWLTSENLILDVYDACEEYLGRCSKNNDNSGTAVTHDNFEHSKFKEVHFIGGKQDVMHASELNVSNENNIGLNPAHDRSNHTFNLADRKHHMMSIPNLNGGTNALGLVDGEQLDITPKSSLPNLSFDGFAQTSQTDGSLRRRRIRDIIKQPFGGMRRWYGKSG